MKTNARNKNRRAQAPKGENRAMMRGMQDLRFSSAAGYHKPDTDYRRKQKHSKRDSWDD